MEFRSPKILDKFHELSQNKQEIYQGSNGIDLLRQRIFSTSSNKTHVQKRKLTHQTNTSNNRQKENIELRTKKKSKRFNRQICEELQIIDLSLCSLSETQKKLEISYSLENASSCERTQTHQTLMDKQNTYSKSIVQQDQIPAEIKSYGHDHLHQKNKKIFVESMISSGYFFHCKLKRPSTFNRLLENKFLLQLENNRQVTLCAKRGHGQQIFRIFLGNSGKQSDYLCSMNTNIIADKFWLTAPIRNLKVLSHGQEKIYDMNRIFLTISYEKLTKNMQRRQMSVFLPPRAKNCQFVVLGETDESILKNVNQKASLLLQTSKNLHQWKIQSDKNCVLKDKKDDFQYLKIEKQEQNIFSIFIGHPLTLIEGFAIALSRFQAQLK